MNKRKFIHNDHSYTRSKSKQLPNIRSQPKQLSIPFVHSDHSYVSSINKNNSNPVEKNYYIRGKPSYAQVLISNLSQTESEPDISLLCEDGTSQTSPLCKKIYTAELISSPVQVHQSEDSVQEQPTEPSSPLHPQLIQQSTAVPNFPSSGNASIDNSICSLYNVPGDGSCFFHALSLGLVSNFSKTIQYRGLICKTIFS
jgi:hypothetical protein